MRPEAQDQRPRRIRFDTSDLDVQDGFEAWRQGLSPIFDVLPPDHSAPGPFRGQLEICHLGDIIVGRCRLQPQRFRSTTGTRQSDHILVQFHRTGGYAGQVGEKSKRIRAGTVSLFDLGQSVDKVATDADIANVLLPRDLFAERPGFLDHVHGLTLPAENASLLGPYLHSLTEQVPHLQGQAIETTVQRTRDMILACTAPDAEARERVRPEFQLLLRARIQDFIRRHLHSPQLTPDFICRHMPVSRATLYRLFAESGGIANHIQQQRLLGIRERLRDPGERRPAGEIARQFGFHSPSHFSRRFRQMFGVRPGELRRARAVPDASLAIEEDPSHLSTWLRDFRT